jgi:hypothetical protein
MRFIKRPLVIEAVQVRYSEMTAKGPEYYPFSESVDWITNAINDGIITISSKNARDYAVISIKTLEGTMEAGPGDWIIRGIKGELYPCKNDIFGATYELEIA